MRSNLYRAYSFVANVRCAKQSSTRQPVISVPRYGWPPGAGPTLMASCVLCHVLSTSYLKTGQHASVFCQVTSFMATNLRSHLMSEGDVAVISHRPLLPGPCLSSFSSLSFKLPCTGIYSRLSPLTEPADVCSLHLVSGPWKGI